MIVLKEKKKTKIKQIKKKGEAEEAHLVDIEGGLARAATVHVLLEFAKHRDESHEEEDEVIEDNHTVVRVATDNGLEDVIAYADTRITKDVAQLVGRQFARVRRVRLLEYRLKTTQKATLRYTRG